MGILVVIDPVTHETLYCVDGLRFRTYSEAREYATR